MDNTFKLKIIIGLRANLQFESCVKRTEMEFGKHFLKLLFFEFPLYLENPIRATTYVE